MIEEKRRQRASLLLAALAALLVALLAGCATQADQAGAIRDRHEDPFSQPLAVAVEPQLQVLTWNVRGTPEKTAEDVAWFSAQLGRLQPAVLCLQEVANQGSGDRLVADNPAFQVVGFHDSPDGQDNAILATAAVTGKDLPGPEGFQHPAQLAYIAEGGFDAVVLTLHLSWTDKAKREQEKQLLKAVVQSLLQIDPDVIVVGDFNTTEVGIAELATAIGLVVMVPPGQDGVGTTHAGNRYDHFLISPDLATEEAVSAHIETFTGSDLVIAQRVSDHLPVTASFRTAARFRDRP
jgi:endonuclease/exonuclease/phosphatase family metal-dependent hydrolase